MICIMREVQYLAGVLAGLSTSTHVALVQRKVWAQPGLSQHRLTLDILHDGQLHLLQYVTEFTFRAKGVLTPASGVAPVAGEVWCRRREADGRHVGTVGRIRHRITDAFTFRFRLLILCVNNS